MTKPLSARQTLFCQNIISGLTQTQAYIDAGYSKTGADGSASRLLGNVRIRKYVEELQKPAEDDIRFTAKRVHEELYNIGTSPEVSPGDRIRAIAEFNKMTGGYEPEKIEVKSALMVMLDRIRDSPNINIKRIEREER